MSSLVGGLKWNNEELQAGLESGSLTQEYMDPNSIRCFVETSVAGADLEEVCRALGQKYKQSVLALVRTHHWRLFFCTVVIPCL
jgi:hypothetical protein